MMEFDEIVVKESPGLCRCCLSEGCYKDLGSEYTWMNETEVYADMLLECFDISVSIDLFVISHSLIRFIYINNILDRTIVYIVLTLNQF